METIPELIEVNFFLFVLRLHCSLFLLFVSQVFYLRGICYRARILVVKNNFLILLFNLSNQLVLLRRISKTKHQYYLLLTRTCYYSEGKGGIFSVPFSPVCSRTELIDVGRTHV